MPVIKIGVQKLLFKMPSQPEAFIASIAAINAYVIKLARANIRTSVALMTPRTWLSDIVVPLSFELVDSVEDRYDLAIDMSEERAKSLANPTSRTCASGFGVLLGFEIVDELFYINPGETLYDLAILNWGETSEILRQAVLRMSPDAKIIMCDNNCDNWEDALASAMVIGMRSEITYLACCARRDVIEFYPEDEYERSFYAKWLNPRYTMMPLSNRSAADGVYPKVWVNFERLWRQFEQRKRMGQPTASRETATSQR